MNVIAFVLRLLGRAWLFLGGVLVLAVLALTWYRSGFRSFISMLNPWDFRNYVSVAIIVGPGLALIYLADAVRQRNGKTAAAGVVAVCAAVALFGGLMWLVRTDPTGSRAEDKRAREYRVNAIRVLNGSAMMNEHRDYVLTQTSGSVGKEGIPDHIKLGDTVTVDGRTIQVRHILVTEILEDLKWGGKTLARKGDVRCMVVETEDDLPYGEEKRNRRWIIVEQCEPIRSAADTQRSGARPLMTAAQWTALGEGERAIYVKGYLETVSFFMYGHSERTDRAVSAFSDWTACAKQDVDRWSPLGWLITGEVDRSAATQFNEMGSVICKDFIGRGDKTWRPVRLISKEDWVRFSQEQKAIYVISYVETFDAVMRRVKGDEHLRRLDACLGERGIEGIIAEVDSIDIEWQYPMPWSVSRAVGKACPKRPPR
jgi:hypothetical protein